MPRVAVIGSLAVILILILFLPPHVQGASNLPWMIPSTTALYAVMVRNTPNMPVVASANWTVLNVTSPIITIREDGILGTIGSLAISLLTSGTVQLLTLRVVTSDEYNLTDRHCLRPCLLPQINLQNQHAWEWIPSNSTSNLKGQNFDILQTVFTVSGNETLAPYNRAAWQLVPIIQVYTPGLILYRFWYDQSTGILLRADLFSQGDGNLTVVLEKTSPNLGIQGLGIPVTPLQISVVLGMILISLPVITSWRRFQIRRHHPASL